MKVAYFLVAVLLALAPASRAEVMSRAQVVAAALSANPEVMKGREQIRSYDGRITEAKADALPDISAQGSFLRYTDPSMLNSPNFSEMPPEFLSALQPQAANSYDGALQLRQTLYSFKVGKALKVARIARQLGGADLKRVQQDIALQAVQAYNALLYAAEQVRVQQNALEQREKHFELTRNRRAAGVATELEVLRAQVNVENQRAEVTRAEGGVELARAQLNALMLRPMDSPITPSDTLKYEPVEYSLDEVTRQAIASRPDLTVAELTEQGRTEAIGVVKADLRPTFNFTATYGRSVRRPTNFLDSDFGKWSTAFNINIPIFDGKRVQGRVLQAQAELARAQQDKIALKNQIRLQSMDAIVKLNVAARLITAAQMNVEQAKKALDMTQANYQYGAATVLDVTDAQNALVQAETTLAQAQQQHADARATVKYVMGQDPAETK
jgi:outer membrane protein TolC